MKMKRHLFGIICLAAAPCWVFSGENLLLNPRFDFHAFTPHRDGKAGSFSSHSVAFWNVNAWGDVEVMRESHVDEKIRPSFSAHNLVRIAPGKKIWQFFTLPEAGLAHGEKLSLSVQGNQSKAAALEARLQLMELDSEDGTWSPSEFGGSDKRIFPRHARGELVVGKSWTAHSDKTGAIELSIAAAEILGRFHDENESHSADINTIGIRVELANVSQDGVVWTWAPCLVKGEKVRAGLVESSRPMLPLYRHLPRTIQKLWKGEPIHIILMGSSIDRGSANPRMVLYDENPKSPQFKQPISDREFDGDLIGRPELTPYFGWWQHYFDYAGRLKLELMRKFDLPVNGICLNFMACDGSSVGEAHSGLADYCSLSIPPDEDRNGHRSGSSWRELYPELFARAEGARPDLIIFGSGANEKTDTPDEVAVFEGTIRWMQRHYPGTEFLFCQFQNQGAYTPNPVDMEALALRYQIPFLDYGKIGDDVTRWCNHFALVPSDGHPQAAAHYLWFKQLEKAFECWDPVVAGEAQLSLPERVHPNTYGWEGDLLHFDEKSPRIVQKNGFIFEDTAINLWGDFETEDPRAGRAYSPVFVDGEQVGEGRLTPARNLRNSTFRYGRTRLGDRHIVELSGQKARLTAVDAKVCPKRRFIGVESLLWKPGAKKVEAFVSKWGAPFGERLVRLNPGEAQDADVMLTDVSIAYVDEPGGGKLRVLIDGDPRLEQWTNVPFVDRRKQKHFLENRKGILHFPYGLHHVRIEAMDRPVAVLGIFTYDSRSNRRSERRLTGHSAGGETVAFSAPFKARPLVICNGDNFRVQPENISKTRVTFSGKGTGTFEVIGE